MEHKSLEEKLVDLLVEHGAKDLLKSLGKVLQNIESAGNGYYIGEAIEALAEVEW